MELRKAVCADLPQIKEMFTAIVADMYAKGVTIWDDYYPNAFFEQDIALNRLYLLTEKEHILAAFVLLSDDSLHTSVEWENPQAKAIYLYRLGVNPADMGKGYGMMALSAACAAAKNMGMEYLRLLVVDSNVPAIKLYFKYGFTKVNGTKLDDIVGGDPLLEYGYEVKL